MSNFYGTLQGSRGPATRCGHSNIRAAAQSWNGSVAVVLSYYGDDRCRENLMVRVETSDESSEYGHLLWNGSIDEFEEILSHAPKRR